MESKKAGFERKGFALPKWLRTAISIPIAIIGFLCGGVLAFSIFYLLTKIIPEGAIPAPFIGLGCLFSAFALGVGCVYLFLVLVSMVPIRCRYCGGRARYRISRKSGDARCLDCGRSYDPDCPDPDRPGFSMSGWFANRSDRFRRFVYFTSFIWTLPLIMLVLGGLYLLMFGIGAPFNLMLISSAYVFLIPWLFWKCYLRPGARHDSKREEYRSMLNTYIGVIILVLIVIAPSRGLLIFWSYYETGMFVPRSMENLLFGSWFDLAVGIVGFLYGLFGLLRETPWRVRQGLQVRNLATSKARTAAVGLAEFQGIARSAQAGEDSKNWPILVHSFELFTMMEGEAQKYSYTLLRRPFYVEDDTGRILVDPESGEMKGRNPLISIFVSIFGRRAHEILLTRRIERRFWPNRQYSLLDGDPVYVIGTVEERAHAAPDAVEADRLVVRASSEGRRSDTWIFKLLEYFYLKPRRDIHDVFFITDLPEKRAKSAIYRGALRPMISGLLWMFLSSWMILGASVTLRTQLFHAVDRLSGTSKLTFRVDPSVTVPGESIRVVFSQPVRNSRRERFWIQVVPWEAPERWGWYVSRHYLPDDSREFNIPAPQDPGRYEVRLHGHEPTFYTFILHSEPLIVQTRHDPDVE